MKVAQPADLVQGNDKEQLPQLSALRNRISATCRPAKERAKYRLNYVFGIETRAQVRRSMPPCHAEQPIGITHVDSSGRGVIPAVQSLHQLMIEILVAKQISL